MLVYKIIEPYESLNMWCKFKFEFNSQTEYPLKVTIVMYKLFYRAKLDLPGSTTHSILHFNFNT